MQIEPSVRISDADVASSPIDGVGELMIPRLQNVMFESHAKESQEGLPSRIVSAFET